MNRQFNHSQKRDAILAVLQGTTCHPAADWVFRQIQTDYPDISLGTVYRNLTILKEEGKILSIGVVDGQERYDGCTVPHSHFVCRSCGCVRDLKDIDVPGDFFDEAARQIGSEPDSCFITFFGKCPGCGSEETSEKSGKA